jgi:SHS2 domain-containing protein
MSISEIIFKDDSVQAELSGSTWSDNQPLTREIKAATYHDLHIEKGEVWRVKIVFDV